MSAYSAPEKEDGVQFDIPSPSKYVKLNVGGALFHTTINTLTKYDCMLKAMFSGRMEVPQDEEGYVLIDRSGKHFSTVLNFLRDGNVPLPECRMEVEEICVEAKYYLVQGLVSKCEAWLRYLNRVQKEPVGYCRVPVVATRQDVERIVSSCTDRPVIELLINRGNNKYSYTHQSDENFLRNQELFDRFILRFNNRVLFIKDAGIGSSEMCLWAFYGKNQKKIELSCTSIVYFTEKKQTKVEFPEARIYEEAMNVLLTFDQVASVCSRCNDMDLMTTSLIETSVGGKHCSVRQQNSADAFDSNPFKSSLTIGNRALSNARHSHCGATNSLDVLSPGPSHQPKRSSDGSYNGDE
ncbi:K+ channel tetramerization domain containing protein [Aphelenchoides avenae]|nr:K+ channel tetramerization domain containing protein [Aphelenchus avenae]